MSYIPFLQELFRDAEGFVPFTIAYGQDRPTEGTWEYDHLWHPATHIVNSPHFALPVEPDDGFHVYFTPHPFVDPSARVKENAHATGTCVWLECDDEDFNFYSIDEALPTAVVETSAQRHHIYFFLTEPAPLEEIEHVNKVLAYKYLTRDRSGWDLTQLMRVPTFFNYKRNTPFEVELVEFNPDRRVEFYEAFGDLLDRDVDIEEEGARSADFRLPEGLRTPADIRDQYEEQFTPQFTDHLAKRAPDRSKALWYMYHECYRMNMNRADCGALLINGPNNKFKDSRYNWKAEFWADLYGCYRMLENNEPRDIRTQIDEVRELPKVSRDRKQAQIADIVRDNMTSRGGFYYASDEQRVVYHFNRRLIDVSQKNTDFRSFIDRQYTLNPMGWEFPYVAEHLRDYAVDAAQRITLHNVSYFDAEHNRLYISDNRGGMYRLDGESIDHLEMGIDGVMFNSQPMGAPIYRKPHQLSPLDECILSLPNYNTDQLSRKESMLLVRSWLYSMFFLDESKPILLVEGTWGSGKTTLFKALEWVLIGPTANVTEMKSDPKEMREVFRNKHHVFVDGVEAANNWQQNVLSTAATGSQDNKRVLYTDNEQAHYSLKPALGLTTMSARYLRPDVLDRSIVLNAERFTGFRSIDDIKATVLTHRGEIWNEIILDLNAMLRALPAFDAPPARLRMASYETFLRVLCRLRDADPDPFIKYLKGEQDTRVLAENTVAARLRTWLDADEARWDTAIDVKTLHNGLAPVADADNYRYRQEVPTADKLVYKLREMEPNFPMEKGRDKGKITYTFRRP